MRASASTWRSYAAPEDVDWSRDEIPIIDLGNLDPSTRSRAAWCRRNRAASAARRSRYMIELALAGRIDGITFAPLNKAALHAGGWRFNDEHQMFAHLTRHQGFFGEMNVLDNMWMSRVTSHVSLRTALDQITPQRIDEALTLADAHHARRRLRRAAHRGGRAQSARRRERPLRPRGDRDHRAGGREGRRARHRVHGPVSRRHRVPQGASRGDFDGVLTMYHDQGQIATKLKGFNRGVTVTGGLRDRVHHAGARHRVRHRRQGCRDDRRARTGGPSRRAARRRPQARPPGTRRVTPQGRHHATLAAPAAADASLTDYVAGFVVVDARPPTSRRTSRTSASARCSTASASRSPAPPRRQAASRAATSTALGIATPRRQHRDRQRRCGCRRASPRSPTASRIHADDYDDTQLAVAKDRVYGLLTHPTAPALPPVLALAERDQRSGARPDARLPGRRRSRMQGGRGDHAAPLPARLPQHRDLRRDRRRGRRGEAARASIARPRAARWAIGATQAGGLARELRHHDQAVSRGTRGGKRRRRGGARGARASPRRPTASRPIAASSARRAAATSAEMIDGQARQSVDLRLSRRVDQAASVGLAHASGHGGDAGPHPRARHQARAGEARHGRHQPQHAQRAHPSSPDERAAGEVQHGILHGDPAARAQGRARAVHRRGRQPPRRAGDDRRRWTSACTPRPRPRASTR